MATRTITSAWLMAVLGRLAQCGLDAESLSRGLFDPAKLPPRVDAVVLRHIWHRAVEASDDPLLGIEVGCRMTADASHVLTMIVTHSATVAQAIEQFVRYQALVSEAGRFIPEPTHGGVRASFRPHVEAVSMNAPQIDTIVAAIATLGPKPALVQLVRRRSVDASVFAARLGCPVEFHDSTAALVYDDATLSRPRENADRGLFDLGIAHAENLLATLSRAETLKTRVRIAVDRLGLPDPTVEQVAAQVGLSERTLQRRLGAEGTSFRRLMQEIRMEEAAFLLRQSAMSVEAIALRLGYSEVSAFSHAVAVYWGASPRALRERVAS